MKISEIFTSIQGEGPSIGQPVIFIRLAGCNLRCKFCDSKYSWKEGKEWKWEEVVERVKIPFIRKIIWTGGEPALQMEEIEKVIMELRRDDYKFIHEIETNGTIKFNENLFEKVIISPKKEKIDKKVIGWFEGLPNIYWKFVVENRSDFHFWYEFCEENNIYLDKSKIYFMPEGVNDKNLKETAKWLADLCKINNVNFSPRLQIWLWGKKRGV